jgi:uncharacterized membrane protein YsdA (DUF1294 family)
MSAVTAVACLLVLLVAVLSKSLGLYWVVINVVACGIVAVDKFRGLNQWYRTRESDFYVLYLFGGWIGGLLGMMFLRHKTRKASFLTATAVASAINVIVTARLVGWI